MAPVDATDGDPISSGIDARAGARRAAEMEPLTRLRLWNDQDEPRDWRADEARRPLATREDATLPVLVSRAMRSLISP